MQTDDTDLKHLTGNHNHHCININQLQVHAEIFLYREIVNFVKKYKVCKGWLE